MSYNPLEGRWAARDPIGFEGGGLNLYGYEGDAPTSRTDPSGLAPRESTRDWWWNNVTVRKEIQKAWEDALPWDPTNQHEEGGWIYYNRKTNTFRVDRWQPGPKGGLGNVNLHISPSLKEPPEGFETVGRFHVHPPLFEPGQGTWCGTRSSPSPGDRRHVNIKPKRGLIVSAPYIPGFPPKLDLPPNPDPSWWQGHPYFPPGFPISER